MSKDRTITIIAYIIVTVVVLCIMHVIAHITAYVSVNWGTYVICAVVLQFACVVAIICSNKYVKVEYFMNTLGIMAWLYMYNHDGTYWQYYVLIWVCYCLGIIILLSKHVRDRAHTLE